MGNDNAGIKEYFALLYRLDGADAYIVWFSNDQDGVLLDASGSIPAFNTLDEVQHFAVGIGITLQNDIPILHDLDKIQQWLKVSRKKSIDPVAFLSAWNLFNDVLVSKNIKFDYDRRPSTDSVYVKLFAANNLPAITPPGKHYIPIWTRNDIKILRNVLFFGLSEFRRFVNSPKR